MGMRRTKWGAEEKQANRKLRTRCIELDYKSGYSYRIPIEDVLELSLWGIEEAHQIDAERGIVREYKYCSYAHIKLKKAECALDADLLTDMFNDNSLCRLRYLSAKGDIIETVSLAYSPAGEDSKENVYSYSVYDGKRNLLIDIEGDRD